MMSRFFASALLGGCFLLTGCVFPQVTHTTAPSSLSSPYRDTEATLDKGRPSLSFHISDPSIKNAEFTKMQLLRAVLITDSGQEIDLGRPYYTGYGIGVTYNFDLGKVGFTGDDFGLRITVSLDGKTTTITGKFTVQGHFEIRDMENDLDPSGK